MRDAFLARYGGQDLARTLGVQELTTKQKIIAQYCILEHANAEVEPLNRTGGSS